MADVVTDRKAELERYYIRLLEQRIADLEAITKTSPLGRPSLSLEGSEDSPTAKIVKGPEAEVNQIEDKKKRIRNVVSKWDPQTGIRKDVPIDDTSLVEQDKSGLAFTFRRVLPRGNSPNQNDGYSEVDIESEELRDMLGEVIGEYTGQSWEGSIANIRSPFAPIVHFWDSLQIASKSIPSDSEIKKQARSDLELLLEQVMKDSELDAYFKTRQSNLAANLTTYETMWTLFIPGKEIYAKPFLGMPQIFIVQTPPMFWEKDRNLPPTVDMDCWCYDWNGKEMSKVWYYIPFDRFRGTKPINELVAYPIHYYKDDNPKAEFRNQEGLVQHIIDRGIRFDATVRNTKGASQQHEYDGEALADRRNVIRSTREEEDGSSPINPNDPNRPRVKEDQKIRPVRVKGKYIVDHEAFLKYGSGNHTLAEMEPNDVQDLELGLADERTTDTAAGQKYLSLLPPRYLGYATGGKFWGQFSVKGTEKVSKGRATMFKDQLKLKDEYKQMIQALVSSHESKNSKKAARPQVKDVVEDKGKGLVILLHGPPGVGKTLTAETIAEASGKPLFVVSVAEIGLNASKAEKNLEQMFALAGAWEAVLLVDEADVFLERRTTDGEANRNALVSVLLRVLEYYQGIMILTTNRITSLDVAVQSRIHLAIRYEDLSEDYKAAIFNMFLDQLDKQEPESIKDRGSINDWIEEYGRVAKLNGRQIRNVISAALALARSKEEIKANKGDERLTVKHIKRVVRITHDFQEQLESVTTASRMLNEVKGGSK